MNITEFKSVINIGQYCFNIDFLTLSEIKSDIKLLIFFYCFDLYITDFKSDAKIIQKSIDNYVLY